MDVIKQFKVDVRQGRVDVDRLVELVVMLARRLEAAQRRIEELERQPGGGPPTQKLQEPFSLRAEEKRQQARGKKRPQKKRPPRRGRITTAHKIAQTLAQILDPATFAGIVVSDDAAVYANFTHAQKCWAHLLRKAIKLTLLDPDNTEYRRFTDRLLEIYRAACRAQRDGRLGDAGRARKVAELDDAIVDLCGPVWVAELAPSEGPANDYRLLCNELMRLMVDRQLFTFVTAAAVKTPHGETTLVEGTNNEAERTLRAAADARKTGRTSKTLFGARRRTVIVSVLESLRQQLPTFTLSSVIHEIQSWSATGMSCFAKLLRKLQLPHPSPSILDLILPGPSG